MTLKSFLAHGLFWSWNAIFLAVVWLGLLPAGLAQVLLDVVDGGVPLSLALSAALLLLPEAIV